MKPERSENKAESIWTRHRPKVSRTFELGSFPEAAALASVVYQMASDQGVFDIDLSVQGTKLWVQISPAKSDALTEAVSDLTGKIDAIYQFMTAAKPEG